MSFGLDSEKEMFVFKGKLRPATKQHALEGDIAIKFRIYLNNV
jgi:hypothetical protein